MLESLFLRLAEQRSGASVHMLMSTFMKKSDESITTRISPRIQVELESSLFELGDQFIELPFG